MEDIEDLVNELALGEAPRVTGRVQPVKVHARGGDDGSREEESGAAGVVPGRAKIWSKTFGCSHNVSDGEYMEGALQAYGYTLTENKEEADLWLVNSCTVKDPSQSAFINLVNVGKQNGKGIVVSGCVPQADRKIKELEDVSMVGVTQIDKIVDVVEKTLEGNTVRLLAKKDLPRLDLPKVRKNKLVEIVPLSTGCLGSCTYCKTKHARGKLGSYDSDAIVDRVRSVLEENTRPENKGLLVPQEFWLASEDTGAYGRDIGTDIATLMIRLTKTLQEYGSPDTMLRLGMTNPPFILGLLDRIAEALRHPNVFRFLHIPVQSGNNKVLEDMNREYTVEQFSLVADYMIKHVPGITIATDIICGFPGETEEEFEDTMKLVRKYQFPILNISQFYPRPGTPAAKMPRVKTQIVKERSRRLSKLFESYLPYENLVGQVLPCWVAEEVSKDGEQTIAHTQAYVKVTLTPRNDELKGKRVMVQIQSSHKFHVEGVVVEVV